MDGRRFGLMQVCVPPVRGMYAESCPISGDTRTRVCVLLRAPNKQVRFGPDVEWLSREARKPGGTEGFESFDYDVDPSRAVKFAEAIRR